MAFQTGSATDIGNLFTQLNTFLSGLGWSLDGPVDSAGFGFNKGGVFVQFRWDGTSPAAAGAHMGVYQSTAYDGAGTRPGSHTGDSGQGASGGATISDNAIANSRNVSNIGGGPFPNYWFFADTSPVDYVHIVVEVRPEEFRHFGFGNLEKFGDGWTGGEYAYGHRWGTTSPTDTRGNILFDGLSTSVSNPVSRLMAASLRVSGLPGQDPSSIWGVSFANPATTAGDDRSGNPRVHTIGTARGGPASSFSGFTSAATAGFVPMTPVAVYYVNGLRAMLLGHQRDVRMVNMRNISPREEITISTEPWIFFPTSIRTIQTSGAPTLSSFTQGIAYKRIP